MEDKDALALCERFYFHELECREKLIGRLQLGLAMLTALVGLQAFVILGPSFQWEQAPNAAAVFLVSFILGTVLGVTATVYYVRALCWHSYECMPFAGQIEAYRKELLETYASYEDGASIALNHHRAFLVVYYADCATRNAKVNAGRYDCLHQSTVFVVLALPFVVLCALVAHFSGLAPSELHIGVQHG